ncbi:serine-rich adhesin for platelets [Drosophila tropicalis]|uniref:serine-rich adhesin for platelets n=1 Tax=Drosophila tropicalis TaxID=46794 RepID=UPI0035ABD29E
MRSYSLAFLAVTTIFLLCCCCCFSLSNAEYPGVIELVGYSNRRARTYFVNEAPTLTPPASKTRADIETVKRNMKKYDRLLELDTKNLPEQQKDMLARIVERVARLKESLDIEEQQLIQQEAASSSSSSARSKTTQETEAETEMEQSTLPPTGSTETETDPTLLLDETTLLELQNTMNEQAAIQQAAVTAQTMLMKEDIPTTTDLNLAGTNRDSQETTSIPQPTTAESEATKQSDETAEDETEESSTFSVDTLTDSAITSSTEDEEDDQFVAARSNNNIAAITAADADPPSTATTSASSSSSAATAGSQQRTLTTHMGKLKNRATKRPFGHKVTAALKRGGQRPAAALAAANSKPSTASTSSSTSTTAAIQKQKLQQKIAQQATKQQQKVTSPAAGGGGGGTASLSSGATNPASSATPSLPIEQLYTRTPQANIPLSVAAASSSSAAAAGAAGVAATTYSNQQQQQQQQQDSMVYDGHVNASALIDSLNTHAREEYYQQKLAANSNKDNKKTATAKPTKYHYYPHNQHIYLLPECAIQQVCNAVYVRLNYTQPLCACPSRYRDPCSASLNEDDQHTTKLVGDNKKKAITLAKTCEATTEMRECRSPKDWSLLALQNTRTGKSHYLVICRCPDHFKMEGPMAHDQPTYASVPGIRVFGMMCVKPGYSVRKPSAQPPKRYQLQKPFYRPGSSSIGSNQFGGSSSLSNVQKDSYGRPIYGNGNGGNPSSSLSSSSSSAISSNYQPQDQSFSNGGSSSYQYLNRPESSQIHSSSSANFRPDQFSINNFPGSNYGRNNERRGNEPPIEAEPQSSSSTTQPSEEARTTQSEQTESELTTLQQEQSMQEESRSKRSLDTGDEPEFPWDRVLEFQQTIVWD